MRFETLNITLKWILTTEDLGCGLGSSRSGYRPVTGTPEHGNEPSGVINNVSKYKDSADAWRETVLQ